MGNSLKGKVLEHPKQQHWRVQFHDDDAEFQYSLEHKAVPWSPHVANLHMGHIQVKVSGNVPDTVPDECATTCSLSLLRMIRDKWEKEAKKIKGKVQNQNRIKMKPPLPWLEEEKIRKMAMEMKEKRARQERSKYMCRW